MGKNKVDRMKQIEAEEYTNEARKALAVTLLKQSLGNSNDSRSKTGLIKDAIRLLA